MIEERKKQEKALKEFIISYVKNRRKLIKCKIE